MKKKSPAFYRYCSDMSKGHLSYFEPEEIEDAVNDLIEMNMAEEAENLIRKGLSQHPDNEMLEKLLIWALIHSHRFVEAEELFARYEKEESEFPYRVKFLLQVIQGHPQKALDFLTEALDNGKVQMIDWVDSVDEMMGEISQALLVPYLTKVIKHAEGDAESLGRIGSMFLEAQMFKEAADVLEKALDLNAYDLYSWEDLARSYLMLNEWDKCQEACRYGLAIEEKNLLLNYVCGYTHFQKGEYKECIPYLKETRDFAEGRRTADLNLPNQEIQDQISMCYSMLGRAYMFTEQFEQAEECYQIMLERYPTGTEAMTHLAALALQRGDLNDGKKYLRMVIDTDPNEEKCKSLLASIHTSMREFDEAATLMKDLVHSFPMSQTYLLAYAELCRQAKRDEESDAAFRKLLKMEITDSKYRAIIRAYFEGIGDDEAAKQMP